MQMIRGGDEDGVHVVACKDVLIAIGTERGRRAGQQARNELRGLGIVHIADGNDLGSGISQKALATDDSSAAAEADDTETYAIIGAGNASPGASRHGRGGGSGGAGYKKVTTIHAVKASSMA
jgi:hypothetical protein